MDALIAASARALARGDPLGALDRVALREDPPALALRGVAMAQLGEHVRSRLLLRRAARAFGPREELARARCALAEAEVALAMRDLGAASQPSSAVSDALERHGDRANALHARLLCARRSLLLGRLDAAAAALRALDPRDLPPASVAIAELVAAELSLRSLRSAPAREALERAGVAAGRAGIPALAAEVAGAREALARPVGVRRTTDGAAQAMRMDEVEALLASGALLLDACRRGVAAAGAWRPLARRPVLFALARALAEAWSGDVGRDALIATVFRTRRPDDTHRARLRVEIARLRARLSGLATIEATARGFALRPAGATEVVVLAPPVEGEQASVVALLADGAAWSTSALAQALGTSQRTVQRALAGLETAGRVRSVGRARARRWLSPPIAGFATLLLLPATLPGE